MPPYTSLIISEKMWIKKFMCDEHIFEESLKFKKQKDYSDMRTRNKKFEKFFSTPIGTFSFSIFDRK